MNKNKTCIIGLDGATFDLLMPWIKKGKLPNLKKMLNEGTHGHLETVFPPITPAAWTSFMTGQNPGKHGVMDFLYREKDSYDVLPYSSDMLRSKTLWELLSDNDKKVCVVNVPMTYPPKKVNGYMLTGLETPRIKDLIETNFTYPKDLKKKFLKEFPDYQIMPKNVYRKGMEKERIEELTKVSATRAKAVKWLIGQKDWDFFMVVFGGTDLISHDFWHIVDKTHPKYDEKKAREIKPLVLKYFQEVDKHIGEFMKSSKFTHYGIMSDHGFGKINKWVYLNCWLRKEGFLKLKKTPISLIKTIMFDLGITPANVYNILTKFGFSKAKTGQGKRAKLINKFFLGSNDIDWKKTKVYAQGHVGQLYVNLKGREPEGIVEKGEEYEKVRKELKEKLEEFKDPDTGENVVEEVYFKEDLYKGPHFENIADVLFKPMRLEYWTLGVASFTSNKIIGPAFGNTGNHRMNGVFALHGEGVKGNNEIKNAQIIDVLPTILHLMDIPIPEDVDGKVLNDALEKKAEAKKSTSKMAKETSSKKEKTYTKEEEADIRKRLEDLGYLS